MLQLFDAVRRCNIHYFGNSKVFICNDMVKLQEDSSWSLGESWLVE